MSRSADTLYRQWVMLSRIPRQPRKITVSELKSILVGEGYTVTTRTIQRDLEKLSSSFPLSNDSEGRTNYWYWIKEAAVQDLPGMDPVTALAFEMAESYLKPLLPQVTIDLLQPYFYRAREVLSDHSGSILRSWPGKVEVIDRGPILHKPVIKPEIQQVIYQSLLEETTINARYQPRESESAKDYLMHPLGIVSRMGVLYLVCTLWDYNNPKQFALHRFVSAEKSNQPYQNNNFNLHTYTEDELQFSYPTNQDPIHLKVLFEKRIAQHLAETPLSQDQQLTLQDDGRILLEATVTETLDLRWWLQGFADNIEVLEPLTMRNKFKEIAVKLTELYAD